MHSPVPHAPLSFEHVHDAEVDTLRGRRTWAHKQEDRHEQSGSEQVRRIGPPAADPGSLTTWNTVGLALSGGGIRSATFCLGVLQALDVHRLINQVDYLSTVSGGGYIGAALSSTLQSSKGQFVFGGRQVYRDTDSVGQLRNYSNYLLPRDRSAVRNYADAIAIVGRGLVANVLIVGGAVLLLALITAAAYPNPETLHGSFIPRLLENAARFLLHAPSRLPGSGHVIHTLDHRFALTLALLVSLFIVQAAWAIRRSTADWRGTDVSGPFLTIARVLVIATFFMAFLDVQAAAIFAFHRHGWLSHWMGALLKFVVLPSGIFATVVSFLSGRTAEFLRSTRGTGEKAVIARRIVVQAVLLFAALFVPVLLWLSYLALVDWMISQSEAPWSLIILLCAALNVAAWLLAPNANSLHRFYRDRLSRAFLFQQVSADVALRRRWKWKDMFTHRSDDARSSQTLTDPDKVDWNPKAAPSTALSQDAKIVPRDPIALGELDCHYTPFHLLNATLNLQGSVHANKRGRDCDFLVFTPQHYGSALIGYYPVSRSREELAKARHDSGEAIDLATAVAISGAAASSAMGGLKLFKALAPTLALLNIRLGYWLNNPNRARPPAKGKLSGLMRGLREQLYLLTEMLQLLDERSDGIYLTDGGHIENLGMYELLRRGCGLVIVVDAEADRDIACGSLVSVSRYARIDFGTRIEIDTRPLAAVNRAVNDAVDAGMPIPTGAGPHAALGWIRYPNGVTGCLLYIKACLSGDEPDYVLRYKQANPTFPHETTGDQFFSEEQFECYRALGFHAADRLFSKKEAPACADGTTGGSAELVETSWKILMHA